MSFLGGASNANEAMRGELAWHFYFWMMRDGHIKNGLADASDPVWRSARTFIDTLPPNRLDENPGVLYFDYTRKGALSRRPTV